MKHEINRNNITVITVKGATVVTLHTTAVVTVDAQRIVLDNGGWVTATTCMRMNQAGKQLGLGYNVSRKHGEMYARVNGIDVPFVGSRLEIKR